jgi:hypothetical protein
MSVLVSDIINQAAVYIGLMRPGGTLTSLIQNDFLARLQAMWMSAGADELISNAWYHQSFTLTAGTASYTVGPAGSLSSTVSPSRIVGFQSVSGTFRSQGKVLSFQAFDEQVQDAIGSSAVLAQVVATDNAWPAAGLRVFPVPATGPGSLWLDYYGQMIALATTGQDITALAPEYQLFLWTNLAMLCYPIWARAGFDPTVLIGMAKMAKDTITAKNRIILSAGTAPQEAAA